MIYFHLNRSLHKIFEAKTLFFGYLFYFDQFKLTLEELVKFKIFFFFFQRNIKIFSLKCIFLIMQQHYLLVFIFKYGWK